MSPDQARLLRELFDGTAFDAEMTDFAAALGAAPSTPGSLLVLGTPDEEPWHFTAHLRDEAEWASRPELEPTLVRWHVPADAPAHLAVPVERLDAVTGHETVLVISPGASPEQLLDRLADVRKHGAHLLAVESGDSELRGLAHDVLSVPGETRTFDVAQHLLSAAAPYATGRSVRSLRERLGLFLDRLQGTPVAPRRPRSSR